MEHAIQLEHVCKSFGSKRAVDDFDLVVPRGGLYGFIGPNGAGKTTTIRMIMSILFPDSGSVRVLGRASALEAKNLIGYLPEERGLYKTMKVGAFLRYIARLKDQDGPHMGKRVRAWLERVGLGEVEGSRCEELSKGMQQKVQFIAAVLHEPDLLILDEPFSGLDPVNQRLMRDLVVELHERGTTVIFSTHVMVQAEQICNHVVMINRGVKVLDETVASIRRRFDPRTVLLEPLDPAADPSALRALPAVGRLSVGDGVWRVALADHVEPGAGVAQLAAALPVTRVELLRPTLEDVFVQLVTGGEDAEAEEVERLRAAVREAERAEAS